MTEFNRDIFRDYWKQTEIIREYELTLYTFGDMQLPYIFAAEHSRYSDRTIIRRGTIIIKKPHIMLPGKENGPEFTEGFEHADALPADAVYLFRAMGLPYSEISNRPAIEEKIEYGNISSVLDRLDNELEDRGDTETGLIKGNAAGTDIALMRYSLGLSIKSGKANVSEFLEHIRKQQDAPIRPDEKLTEDDLRRLFG